MHLMDMLALRPVPAAGLFLSLTRRSPLYSSTTSLIDSDEQEDECFIRFVSTLTSATRPEIVYLTGGEALLRPRLVYQLTELCHAVGSRVCLLSGMFFARHLKVPRLIEQALGRADHFVASLDIFHEQQVSRAAVFRVLQQRLAAGQDVSLQVVGLDERDPYLRDITSSVRETFADRVPVLVSSVQPLGRGVQTIQGVQQLAPQGVDAISSFAAFGPSPCAMAAWPVVTYNGAIVGCCNQHVVDGKAAPHLQFGHIATDDWPAVRERYLNSVLLRALRVFGPAYTNNHFGCGKIVSDGYCATCLKLSSDPEVEQRLRPVLARASTRLVEKEAARPQAEHFVRQHGIAAYAHLVTLGYAHDYAAAQPGD